MLKIWLNTLKIMKKSTFLIVGKHAVLEALKNPSRKIERVFLTEDAQKKLNRENQNLNLFKKINVFYKSKKELDNLCGRDETAHQGLVAEVEQLDENRVRIIARDEVRKTVKDDLANPNSQILLSLPNTEGKISQVEKVGLKVSKSDKVRIRSAKVHS